MYIKFVKLLLGVSLLGLLLGIGISYALTSGGDDSPPPGSPAMLHENKGHLFVPPDELRRLQVSHTFELTNSTHEAWTLEFVGSSCGCTRPSIADATLGPGEVTELTVTIEAAGQKGHLAEYVELRTNATVVPKVLAYLQADVHPRLSLSGIPAIPVLVATGGRKTLELEVASEQMASEEERRFELVASTSPTCEAKLGKPVVTTIDSLRRVVRCTLSVALIAPKAVKEADFSLRRETIEVECGSFRVSQDIVWRVLSPIESRPRVVFIQRGAVGSVSRQVVLSSESQFSVRSVHSSSSSLSVEVPMGIRGASHVATVTAGSQPADAERGRFETHKITFVTDHPQRKEIAVSVQVMAPQRSSLQ